MPGVSKVGRRLLFSKQVLLDWIESNQQKTDAQIRLEANQKLVNKKGGLEHE